MPKFAIFADYLSVVRRKLNFACVVESQISFSVSVSDRSVEKCGVRELKFRHDFPLTLTINSLLLPHKPW